MLDGYDEEACFDRLADSLSWSSIKGGQSQQKDIFQQLSHLQNK